MIEVYRVKQDILEEGKDEKDIARRIKKMLSEYNYTCRTIHNLQEEIYQLGHLIKSERDTTKAITYELDGGRRTNTISDPTAHAVTKIIDRYEAQIAFANQRLAILYEEKNMVETWMDQLDEQEREIIQQKYFMKKQWWQVAGEIGFSERHCKRLSAEIIRKIMVL